MTALALPISTALQPGSPEFEKMATAMADTYGRGCDNIRRLVGEVAATTAAMSEAFAGEDLDSQYRAPAFGIELCLHGRHSKLDTIFAEWKRDAWRCLANRLGIKNIMSVKQRAEFEKQLDSGELPDITALTINQVIMGMLDQATDFATTAVREVFDYLRPAQGYWGSQYKTNSAFRVGRRVILTYTVQPNYRGGFRANYDKEKYLTAMDGVFHLLDGKGIMRQNRGPLVTTLNATNNTGRGETEYFKFKCYKNHNLHLEFKRLDLVKQLNGIAVGDFVLGEDNEG